MTPVHAHDCDGCVYLGTVPEHKGRIVRIAAKDFYVCPQMGYPTMIMRYGTEGDYSSHDDIDYWASREQLPAEWVEKAIWLMRHWRKHYGRRERMRQRRATRRQMRRRDQDFEFDRNFDF